MIGKNNKKYDRKKKLQSKYDILWECVSHEHDEFVKLKTLWYQGSLQCCDVEACGLSWVSIEVD
jgi:hypothetical protein